MTRHAQVVVVTGGSRGIGRACVLRAAGRGAHVVFCSRSGGDAMRAVEDEVAASGAAGSARGLIADISREQDVVRLFDAAGELHGRIDAVIHNAAISRESLLVTATAEDLDQVLATNLTGSFLVARQAVRTLLRLESGGRIVFVGTLSQHGAPGNASYATSKGGVSGLMESIAHRYAARSIRANLIVTGYVKTTLSASLSATARRALVDGSPLRRSASADEIAAVAMFLLSEDADGLNGQSVYATGGLMEVPL